MKNCIIVSATSEIAAALYQDWIAQGWNVVGTSRSCSDYIYCDFLNSASIDFAAEMIKKQMTPWDVLLFAPGTLEPVAPFENASFDQWASGIQVNLLGPLQLLHALLPFRNADATVLFFAGAGTNGPAPSYSAYALSKIGLIKMCELLDAEIKDARFAIVGPGWVKTKIHEATLNAGEAAGANYQRTLETLAGDHCTPMSKILECCRWLITTSVAAVSGRNYSVVYDAWGSPDLEKNLSKDCDLFKLRRLQRNVL